MQKSDWDLILSENWTFYPWIHFYGFCFCLYWFYVIFQMLQICCEYLDILYQLIICSLKVFCFVISSSFSVRRQSTSVPYFVQSWQNVLSIPFVTYTKSISKDHTSDFFGSFNCKDFSFARTESSFNFMKTWNSNIFQRLFAFVNGILILLGLKWSLQTNALATLSLPDSSFLLCPEMPCNHCF